MRTTITVADDVLAEMERLRREDGLGPSEALMMPARRGMANTNACKPYEHRTAPMGMKVDVANMGEVLLSGLERLRHIVEPSLE